MIFFKSLFQKMYPIFSGYVDNFNFGSSDDDTVKKHKKSWTDFKPT